MRIAVLLVGLFASAAFDTAASAKDTAPPEITATGIKDFDDVFMQAKDIQTNLTTSKTKLQTANDDVNTSLGLTKGTPFKDAMADLNKKADGKVKVAMTGKTPTLTAADGCPANVKASVDATNKAVGEISAVVDNMATLASQSEELAKQSEQFVEKAPEAISKSGISVTQVPKVTKTVKTNVGIVEQTPGQVKALGAEATGMLDAVASTFPK
jgi:methyl-accepting chemotaxis protein